MIQNPGFLPNHAQNSITCSLCHARHNLKISVRSVHNFSSYLAHTQTDKQTNKQKPAKHYFLGGGNKLVSDAIIKLVLYFAVLF